MIPFKSLEHREKAGPLGNASSAEEAAMIRTQQVYDVQEGTEKSWARTEGRALDNGALSDSNHVNNITTQSRALAQL